MRSSVATFSLTLLLAPLACSGGPSSTTGSDGDSSSDREGNDDRPAADDPVPAIMKDCPAPRPARGLVRLTHQQYANTIRDLLGETVDIKTAFIQDSAAGPFENSAAALVSTRAAARRPTP